MVILGVRQAQQRDAFWRTNMFPIISARMGSVDMGQFIVSPVALSQQNPVMITAAAGPCIIVAMLSRDHAGALGHVDGVDRIDPLLRAVRRMRTAMAAQPYQIVLTAGSDFSREDRGAAVDALSVEFGATVEWAHPEEEDDIDGYSTAVLFPLRARLLLFSDLGDFGNHPNVNMRCSNMQYFSVVA